MSDPGKEKENSWRLDKHINITHLLLTISMVGGGVWWASNIENRLNLHAQAINNNTQRIEQAERRQGDALVQILNRLDSIESYLRGRDR